MTDSQHPSHRRTGLTQGHRKGDKNYAAILDCAWELLATKPLASITVQDLVSGAGISRPSFYFYFESRDAVVRALAQRVGDSLIEGMASALEPPAGIDPADEPVAGVIHRIVSAYIKRWRSQASVLRAMHQIYETDGQLREFWDPITNRIVDDISSSIELERRAGRAVPGAPDARELARVLMAMLWRTGYELSINDAPEAEWDARVDAAAAVAVRAIYGSYFDVSLNTTPTRGASAQQRARA